MVTTDQVLQVLNNQVIQGVFNSTVFLGIVTGILYYFGILTESRSVYASKETRIINGLMFILTFVICPTIIFFGIYIINPDYFYNLSPCNLFQLLYLIIQAVSLYLVHKHYVEDLSPAKNMGKYSFHSLIILSGFSILVSLYYIMKYNQSVISLVLLVMSFLVLSFAANVFPLIFNKYDEVTIFVSVGTGQPFSGQLVKKRDDYVRIYNSGKLIDLKKDTIIRIES